MMNRIRDQVEPHIEFHAGIVEGVEAAFVGREFFRIGLLIGDDEGDDEKHKPDHPRDTDEDDQRQIGEQQLRQ